MGRQIHITCDGCTLERTELVGVGMMGVEHSVCGCDHCNTIVLRTRDLLARPRRAPRFRCGTCRKPLRIIENDRHAHDEDAYPSSLMRKLGRCPLCGGMLTGLDSGLIWD